MFFKQVQHFKLTLESVCYCITEAGIMIKVSEIMTKPVITASPDLKLSLLEKMMENKKIGHICIVDMNRLVGIVSDGDIKRRKSYLAGTDISTTREEQTLLLPAHVLMTRHIITLSPDATILDAINIFLSRDIHSIPIVAEEMKLLGIITSSNLLRYMKTLLEKK